MLRLVLAVYTHFAGIFCASRCWDFFIFILFYIFCYSGHGKGFIDRSPFRVDSNNKIESLIRRCMIVEE
jgi:hypothetical protein